MMVENRSLSHPKPSYVEPPKFVQAWLFPQIFPRDTKESLIIVIQANGPAVELGLHVLETIFPSNFFQTIQPLVMEKAAPEQP